MTFETLHYDERFLDRGGCGDELYGDAHLKASLWLADLSGTRVLLAMPDLLDDVNFDDAATN